jgi:uncharacterized membrane protein YgdD (TMEM256/DUF423 family)
MSSYNFVIYLNVKKNMNNKILITAVFLGLLSIVLGAFGAHALKVVLNSDQLMSFETGVKYQMYHALFLLFLGSNSFISEKSKKVIFLLTVIGLICFSGSIYLLASNNLTGYDFRAIGFVTPIGGLLLILAWSVLLIRLIRKDS